MLERPCSSTQVRDMRGVLDDYLWGSDGLHTRLAGHLVDLMRHTSIYVEDHAPPALIHQVGAEAPDLHLLGVFTNGADGRHPVIAVFCADVLAVHEDPRDVLEHELGHRFRFDHDRYQARIPLIHDAETASGVPERVCTGPHDLAGHPLGADVLRLRDGNTGQFSLDPIRCPVCRLYSRVAEAHALMEDLSETAAITAMPDEVPLGLGGTVALARLMIADAQLALIDVAAVIPDHGGEMRLMARQLHRCQSALAGWLDTAAVGRTRHPLRLARAEAYRIAHGYFLRSLHAHDVQPRDLLSLAAFK